MIKKGANKERPSSERRKNQRKGGENDETVGGGGRRRRHVSIASAQGDKWAEFRVRSWIYDGADSAQLGNNRVKTWPLAARPEKGRPRNWYEGLTMGWWPLISFVRDHPLSAFNASTFNQWGGKKLFIKRDMSVLWDNARLYIKLCTPFSKKMKIIRKKWSTCPRNKSVYRSQIISYQLAHSSWS